jgi:RNA polymerase sigma-70 factor (ECF subfamily)
MSVRSANASLALPPLLAAENAHGRDRIAIEAEVLALFNTFRDPLLRYVCSFGLAVNEGEDAVQDVFLALFTHLCRDGARRNLRGWLFRVAHNLALKRRARQRRDQATLAAGSGDTIPDPGHDPEEQLVRRERLARVTAVLEALPETDRRCVYLRGSGLRYREIADVLGISLGGVAKSLTRSIARLQRGSGG